MIKKDDELIRDLLDSLRRENKPRDGIHVSDLIFCLKESFFRRKNPIPPTDIQLGYFLDGARRHVLIQNLHGAEAEKQVENYGIHGTIDILDGFPIEIKTTRWLKDDVPPHYLRQLAYYMVLTDKRRGKILIHNLNAKKDSPVFVSFDVTLTEKEFEEHKKDLLARKARLELALMNDSVENLSTPNEAWKCSTCQYKIRCLSSTG